MYVTFKTYIWPMRHSITVFLHNFAEKEANANLKQFKSQTGVHSKYLRCDFNGVLSTRHIVRK